MNLFYGDNAQGKTNLLEAAFLLGTLRSFRGVKGGTVISWGEKEGRVSGEAIGGGKGARQGAGQMSGRTAGRTRRLEVGLEKGGRKVALDGKRPRSAAEYLLALRVISFSPEDLFLVKEHPSARRRFLDRSAFHLNPAYLETANRCRAAYKQLNAAIKTGDRKVVASWEEVAAPLAGEVGLARRKRAEELMPRASELFEKALGGGRLEINYKSALKGADKKELGDDCRALMEKRRAESMKRGHCLVGPHTDDLALTLSGRDIRATASRGQSRLALLALVLADAELYREQTGEYPVLLLDDPASELDAKRRDALVEYIKDLGQVLVTSTDADLLKGRGVQKFKVEAGDDGFAKII